MKASAVGTLQETDAGRLRHVLLWVAALAVALALAASAGLLIHRATTSGTTVPPVTVTQQHAAPQERSTDPTRRLVEINDQPAPHSAPVAPIPVDRTNRLIEQNS